MFYVPFRSKNDRVFWIWPLKRKTLVAACVTRKKPLLNVMSSKHRSKFTAIHWQSWRLNWYVLSGMGKKSINHFTAHSRIFDSYLDVTIAGEGAANFGLYSALRVFEHGRIFIVPHMLWHGASVFRVSSNGPPHSVTSYDMQGGCRGNILTRILKNSE